MTYSHTLELHRYTRQGEYFGERALLARDALRTATVTAITPARCMVVERDSMVRLLGRSLPEVRDMGGRLR